MRGVDADTWRPGCLTSPLGRIHPPGRLGTNAMDTATLAVLGTLCGVVVTATVNLLSNSLNARQQRATTERQLQHAVDERLRTERRDAFTEYFAAYCALREKIEKEAETHTSRRRSSRRRRVVAPQPAPAAASGRRAATDVEEYAAEEAARFYQAYLVLWIIASDAVGEAAGQCTSDLWRLGGDSRSGDELRMAAGWARAKESRRALPQGTRADLGGPAADFLHTEEHAGAG